MNELKNTVIDLIRELKESIFTSPTEISDLLLVEFYFKNISPEKLMDQIIQHVIPYSNYIKEKDLKFFIANKGIFSPLVEKKVISQEKMEYYSNILASGERFDEDDENVVWDYLNVIECLAEQYRKNK